MDIIAAHRDGLTEKLDLECADLAGRSCDFGQRAIVLHHLYDHSLAGHRWALVEAHRQLTIERALQLLAIKAKRWWRRPAVRERAMQALSQLTVALGDDAARRTAAAYRAYRMAGTPAVEAMLSHHMSPDHAQHLRALHGRRREGAASDPNSADALAMAVEADVGGDPAGAITAAWAAIDASVLRKAARRSLQGQALPQLLHRQHKKGWGRLERALREHPRLPAAFRANPAQHFYSLQHGLAERRRKDWVDDVGESEALAA